MEMSTDLNASMPIEQAGVSQNERFNLLGLPRELRDLVYQHAVVSRTAIQHRRSVLRSKSETPDVNTALLCANRQIHMEASDVLYASNTISLRLHVAFMCRVRYAPPDPTREKRFLPYLSALASTLRVRINWLDNWTAEYMESPANTGWYSRSDVLLLKELVYTILKVLEEEGPDKTKTLILEFPALVYSPSESLGRSLRYVVLTGLAYTLRRIRRFRTLQVKIGRYRADEYSWLVFPGIPEGMFNVYEESLELGWDSLANDGSTQESADAVRAEAVVRAEFERLTEVRAENKRRAEVQRAEDFKSFLVKARGGMV